MCTDLSHEYLIPGRDIVAALERHSSRYGVPGIVFTDNGTQLAALTSTSFTPRSLENELKEKLDVKVVVPALRLMRSEDG